MSEDSSIIDKNES